MAYVLIQTQTADDDVSLTFSVDDTYDELRFEFTNIFIHDVTESERPGLRFSMRADGASDFESGYRSSAYHDMYNFDDAGITGMYEAGTQVMKWGETGMQDLYIYSAGDTRIAAATGSGTLSVYAPASTTYVKHFISTANVYGASNDSGDYDMSYGLRGGGFYETGANGSSGSPTAIDAIMFRCGLYNTHPTDGSNFTGTISMYGLS